MYKSLFAAILINFSSLLYSNEVFLDSKIYTLVSQEICNINEYGFKVEYITKNNVKEELYNYKNIFSNIDSIDYTDDFISLNNNRNGNNIILNVASEGEIIRVSLEIKSSNYIDFENLKNKFDNYKYKDDIKYYTYIKSDITENKSIDEIESKLLEIVSLEGKAEVQKMILDKGTTGIINLKSDYQFNYSIMTYEEDRVLILGSPIIFTTY